MFWMLIFIMPNLLASESAKVVFPVFGNPMTATDGTILISLGTAVLV
jgi:hypothetical protein